MSEQDQPKPAETPRGLKITRAAYGQLQRDLKRAKIAEAKAQERVLDIAAMLAAVEVDVGP